MAKGRSHAWVCLVPTGLDPCITGGADNGLVLLMVYVEVETLVTRTNLRIKVDWLCTFTLLILNHLHAVWV